MSDVPESLVKTFAGRFPEASDASIRAALKAADGHAGKAAAQLRKQIETAQAKANKPPTPKAAPKREPSPDSKVDSIASQFPGVDKERIREALKKHNDHAGRAVKELRAASGAGFELAFLQRRFPGVSEQTIKQALVKANGDKNKAEKDVAKAYARLQPGGDSEKAPSEASSSAVPTPRAAAAVREQRSSRDAQRSSRMNGTPAAAAVPVAATPPAEAAASAEEAAPSPVTKPYGDFAPAARTVPIAEEAKRYTPNEMLGLRETDAPAGAEAPLNYSSEFREPADPTRFTAGELLQLRGETSGEPSTSYKTEQRPPVDDTRFTPNELLKLRGDGSSAESAGKPLYTAEAVPEELSPYVPDVVSKARVGAEDTPVRFAEPASAPAEAAGAEVAPSNLDSLQSRFAAAPEASAAAPPVRDFRDYLKASDTRSAVSPSAPAAAPPAAAPPVRDFRDYLKASDRVASAGFSADTRPAAAAPPVRDFRDFYKPRAAPAAEASDRVASAEASLPSTTVLLSQPSSAASPGLRQWGVAKSAEPLPQPASSLTAQWQAMQAAPPAARSEPTLTMMAEAGYRLGDFVQVFSMSQQSWLDGEVVEVAAEDGELSGALIPMGSLFVHYSGTAQNLGKWITPDMIADTLRSQAAAELEAAERRLQQEEEARRMAEEARLEAQQALAYRRDSCPVQPGHVTVLTTSYTQQEELLETSPTSF